jgi:hypothetical protein
MFADTLCELEFTAIAERVIETHEQHLHLSAPLDIADERLEKGCGRFVSDP